MLEPGDVVAEKYHVKALLGRGGMGEVYLVRHALTGRRFALKVLAPTLMGTASTTHASQRLVREALAAGRVEHRNVVDVFDVGEHRGAVYLVMEYLEGRPLSELLETAELSDRAILTLMLRAMEGVAAAHDHGIVHRDLKPENIFVCLTPDGSFDEPRVMDFGISQLPEQLNSGDTNAGFVVGTPHFMCLEQLQGARDLDARVDVYALGVSLYRALSGRVPFEGTQLTELAHRIAHDTPVALGALRPDLPQMLTQTVMRAMMRDRERRHPNVRALSRDLEPFVMGLSDQPMRERRVRSVTPQSSPVLLPIQPELSPHMPTGAHAAYLSGAMRQSVPPSAPLPTVPPARRTQQLAPWVSLAVAVPAVVLLVVWLVRAPEPQSTPTALPSAPAAAAAEPAREPSAPADQPEAQEPRGTQARAPGAPLELVDPLPPVMPRWAHAPKRPAPQTRHGGSTAVRLPPVAMPAGSRGQVAQPTGTAPPPAPAQHAPAQHAPAANGETEPGYDLLHEFSQPRDGRKLDEADPYAN
jgi:serine/threonine protein kinase